MFVQNNNIMKCILGVLIILIIIGLVVVGVTFYKNKSLENTYIINLFGLNNITVYEGDMYNEAGYVARDRNGNDVTNLVKISGDVNTNVVGEYKIVYSINSFFKKNEVTRVIKVLENPIINVNFTLKGDSIIKINLNEEYVESGFVCLDKNNVDCSSYVTIDSNVLTNKIGTYTVNYILRIGQKEKRIERSIFVIGEKYQYELDKTEVVNSDVTIEFKSNINNLDYIIKPNGEKSIGEVVNYKVSSNGEYKFILYDKDGVVTEALVEINNIDKEEPKGSCTALIDSNVTSYKVEATDNGKIVKYVHVESNNSYTTNTFEISSRLENGSVIIYDEASNSTKISCDTNYAYIGVSGNNKTYEYTSETLKYWVEKPNEKYYVIHVWMDDPYNQLKTALPSSFGQLALAKNILNNEVSTKGYSNKGLVAVNGSAFVSSQFDTHFYEKYSSWKDTAVTPIVIHNGLVLRNFTDKVLPRGQYFVYGLTKSGNLKYYSFENVNDTTTNFRTSQQIITDGVKYTFGFRPILVWNSKKIVNDSSTRYKRQGVGQIDKNNFVIISTVDLSMDFIANKMISLGCHTGFNLDGGGSVNLFYKGNNNGIVTLREVSRRVADVLYFVEN